MKEKLYDALVEREELKNTEKYIKDRLTEIEDLIKQNVDLNQATKVGDFTVNYNIQQRTGIDTDALKKREPEIFDRYSKITEFKILRITKK
jgi:predicted phage-related endonuclease